MSEPWRVVETSVEWLLVGPDNGAHASQDYVQGQGIVRTPLHDIADKLNAYQSALAKLKEIADGLAGNPQKAARRFLDEIEG